MKISILTPAYNRAHTLPKLYDSLKSSKNNKLDIEWLIMDDGSTDDTEVLISKWIKEKKVDIKYYKQENQGKMKALNNLTKYITGDITIECDSDDYFTDNCLKDIIDKWDDIKDKENIYGIAFLKVTSDSNIIGNKFSHNGMVANIFNLYFKYGKTGDICLIFKSNVRKSFEHKLEHNERFVTEGRMYHEMDLHYTGLKCFNIPGVICQYLDDGYSKNITDTFKKYPYGYYHYYLEMFNFNMSGITFKKRIHIIKHYILFSYLTNKKRKEVVKNTKGIFNKLLVIILVIPGYIVTKRQFN